MDTIKIKDKSFKIMMTEEEILSKIKVVADKINKDYAERNPLFVVILNGAFMFASDLMKMMIIPCEITFVKVSSYEGTSTTGKVKQLIGINQDLTGRDIIIVEDIVESGITMKQILIDLKEKNPQSVKICSLFVKPEKMVEKIMIDYPVMKIPNDFILGYGLDYDQQGRNLKDLYHLI